jgi:hypothetical protein
MAISNASSGLRPGVCTSTTRPQAPFEGQMIFETDTHRVLVWDNAAWVMIADTDEPPGLQLVASGTLTLTTTPTNIAGVFDNAKYKNYLLLLNSTARSTTNRFDFRYIVGTTPTSVNYYQGGIGSEYATNATVYMQRSNNDNQYFGVSASSQQVMRMDIFTPNVAAATSHTGQVMDRNTGFAYSFGGVQIASTAFTGFQLFSSTGTITVDYQVFGYRD